MRILVLCILIVLQGCISTPYRRAEVIIRDGDTKFIDEAVQGSWSEGFILKRKLSFSQPCVPYICMDSQGYNVRTNQLHICFTETLPPDMITFEILKQVDSQNFLSVASGEISNTQQIDISALDPGDYALGIVATWDGRGYYRYELHLKKIP